MVRWSLLIGSLLGCASRSGSETAAISAAVNVEPCMPPSDCVVRKIIFDGNSSAIQGTGDYSVRAAMEQQKNRRFTFLAPERRQVYLQPETLRLDGWRIETWYAHNGYFDARFLGWDVTVVRAGRTTLLGKKRPPAVRIVGRIDEGEPTVLGGGVSSTDPVVWEGWESLGKGAAPLLSQLETSSELESGSRFSLSAVKATESAAVTRMQEQSYARTTVHSAVEVWPDELVSQVRFIGELGPDCTFGPVTVTGEFGIPRELVLAAISFEEGQAFRTSKLSETRQKLFSMGIFSVVNVTPQFNDPDLPEDVIPIHIDLTERKYRQLKLGGGVLLESGEQNAHVSAEISHANLFNRLVRMTFANQLGYSIISDVSIDGIVDEFTESIVDEDAVSVSSQGITGESTINVIVPRFPGPQFQSALDLEFERGVEQAYQFYNPSFSPSVLWKPKGPWSFKFSYELEYLTYVQYTADISDLLDPRLGLDFTNPYLISSIAESIIYDSRNDPVDVRRGTYSIIEFQEAGGPLGGQFSFIKVNTDYRRYASLLDVAGLKIGGKSLRRRWNWRPLGAVAGRMAGGLILPYGANASVPYAERLYLGGGSDVRGWATDHLGPYLIEECEAGGGRGWANERGESVLIDACSSESGAYAGVNEDILPIGGTLSGLLGVEFRRYFRDTYGLVLFYDTGMVWDEYSDLVDDYDALTSDWSGWLTREKILAPTIGIGGRYKSPVGPARIDIALRLDNDQRFRHEPKLRLHFALAEAF